MESSRNETRVTNQENTESLNKQQQGVDKAPGEENNRGEKVTMDDLKGKKVDADPGLRPEQPIRQLP